MKFCPHCGGDLTAFLSAATLGVGSKAQEPKKAYDQTATWRALAELAATRRQSPPALEDLVTEALAKLGVVRAPVTTIVHLFLDRPVTPQGGMLYTATMTDGKAPKPSIAQLQAQGYLVVNDKLVLIDDIPVGVGYGVLEYWGGAKQHKRWHLEAPITIFPSRNGNPYFMDDEMVAFGATWRDTSAMQSALINLLSSFTEGVRGDKLVAQPLALELVQTE